MIRLEHVSKSYPTSTRPALDDVTVEIDKGEFVFLVGSSGSGKSTFLRLLLKEEVPTGGHVHVAGKDLHKLSSWKVPRDQTTPAGVTQAQDPNCTMHNFNTLPTKQRDVLVSSAYAAGTTVVDFSDRRNPREVGHHDPHGANTWSSYWYNGLIWTNDGGRGVDVMKITGKEGLGFTGKARTFDSEDAFVAAVESGSIRKGEKTVVVLRYLGPKGGPGLYSFRAR